ncbi:hypothetical protein BDW66DRAFT_155383 [Aspergillus desertorum]
MTAPPRRKPIPQHQPTPVRSTSRTTADGIPSSPANVPRPSSSNSGFSTVSASPPPSIALISSTNKTALSHGNDTASPRTTTKATYCPDIAAYKRNQVTSQAKPSSSETKCADAQQKHFEKQKAALAAQYDKDRAAMGHEMEQIRHADAQRQYEYEQFMWHQAQMEQDRKDRDNAVTGMVAGAALGAAASAAAGVAWERERWEEEQRLQADADQQEDSSTQDPSDREYDSRESVYERQSLEFDNGDSGYSGNGYEQQQSYTSPKPMTQDISGNEEDDDCCGGTGNNDDDDCCSWVMFCGLFGCSFYTLTNMLISHA